MSKLLSVLFVMGIVAAVVVRGEFDRQAAHEKLKMKAGECKTEVGATDADIEELVGRKPASTMEGKCLRACLMKKFEVMDASGKFVTDVALKHAEKVTDGAADKMKVASEIINACAGIEVSSDHCQAAEDYGKCFKQQASAHGINENYQF
ncbi:general odorant-binding protein 28a-like [Musca domestica]|uniref:General odorant-binding protein 28a n=1 Tax=Musca domestica TaxID=7370 RepID=A0A1I8N5Z2_MUSDO|nr:general odorant-binding protein 28a [Musca domestica]XP_005188787.1 general odorant-binding protein 28a-like [Musca domestica]XP_058983697.1 general odorant-binding protein 28a-like [Musca domestica]